MKHMLALEAWKMTWIKSQWPKDGGKSTSSKQAYDKAYLAFLKVVWQVFHSIGPQNWYVFVLYNTYSTHNIKPLTLQQSLKFKYYLTER